MTAAAARRGSQRLARGSRPATDQAFRSRSGRGASAGEGLIVDSQAQPYTGKQRQGGSQSRSNEPARAKQETVHRVHRRKAESAQCDGG